MQLFHAIDDGVAIIRAGQVWKQVKLYRRGGVLFIPHSGGYIRITAALGETWGTSNPNVSVIEYEGVGAVVDRAKPRFEG